MMMQERTHKDAEGAILFDAAVSPQVGHDWFAPEHWRERDALRTQAGGRGGVAIIATPQTQTLVRPLEGAIVKKPPVLSWLRALSRSPIRT